MDVFLILDAVVVNIIRIDSLEAAKALFPNYLAVERTEANQQIQIGDIWQ